MGGTRKRAPRHQNTFAFTHNAKSKLTAKILAMPNEGLCKRCWDKVEWRKKYRKYKPLTQPSRCNGCKERNVTAAYHTLCQNCAKQRKVCAWCGEKKFIVSENTDHETFIKTGDTNNENENVIVLDEDDETCEKLNTTDKKDYGNEMNSQTEGIGNEQDEERDEEEGESKVEPSQAGEKASNISTTSGTTSEKILLNNLDRDKIAKNRKKLERELASFPLPLRKKKTILREFDRANGEIEIHRLLNGMSLYIKAQDEDDDFDDEFDDFSEEEGTGDEEEEEEQDEGELEDTNSNNDNDTEEGQRPQSRRTKSKANGLQRKMINI